MLDAEEEHQEAMTERRHLVDDSRISPKPAEGLFTYLRVHVLHEHLQAAVRERIARTIIAMAMCVEFVQTIIQDVFECWVLLRGWHELTTAISICAKEGHVLVLR